MRELLVHGTKSQNIILDSKVMKNAKIASDMGKFSGWMWIFSVSLAKEKDNVPLKNQNIAL